MKILVLGGCGAMGTEATRDLATTSDFKDIVIADVDPKKARALAAELGNGRVRGLALDVTDQPALQAEIQAYDVILNCTSYVFGLIITEAAIAARRPLLDLGGLYNTPKQLAMTEQAKQAGVTIVLGMGATPGVTNLMAKAGSSHMEQVDEVRIAFATYRAIAPSPGLLQTVLDEFSPETRRFYFEDGQLVDVPPFSGEREVLFDAPVGKVPTWFVPHSETHTLPRFIPGLRRVEVRGTWRPEIMQALRHYGAVGLLSSQPLDGVAPKDFLRTLFLKQPPWPDHQECAFLVNVEVWGRSAERSITATYNLSHPGDWEQRTTACVTGIPASIGAQRLARGEVRVKGVVGPEAAFEPWSFFEELARRDILVREEVLTVRGALAPQKAGRV